MQNSWIYDPHLDYVTNAERKCVPLDDLEWALTAVKDTEVGKPWRLGAALTEELDKTKGKDGGWSAQAEADDSVTVERHFTQRRGMSYVPITYAFRVVRLPEGIAVTPSNERAKTWLQGVLDGS